MATMVACKKPPNCHETTSRDNVLHLQQEYNAGHDPCPDLVVVKLSLGPDGLSVDGNHAVATAALPTETMRRVDVLFNDLQAAPRALEDAASRRGV